MPTYNVKCVGPNCGGVVLATATMPEGKGYKGDEHYGYYCNLCAPTLFPPPEE